MSPSRSLSLHTTRCSILLGRARPLLVSVVQSPIPRLGSDAQNPRRQVNAITAFIDGSQVYGSDRVRASALRTNDGTGKLKTSSDGRLLPYNEQGLDNEGGARRTTLFVAGDVRVNEQIGLTAMHTLFVREHNRLTGIIATQNPGLSGDEIYDLARKIVGAQIQNFTFSEFLPLLLGPDGIDDYEGYDATVDPTIASEFSAAAYRVGHTLLSPKPQPPRRRRGVREDQLGKFVLEPFVLQRSGHLRSSARLRCSTGPRS